MSRSIKRKNARREEKLAAAKKKRAEEGEAANDRWMAAVNQWFGSAACHQFAVLTPAQITYIHALYNMKVAGRSDPWTVAKVLAGPVEGGGPQQNHLYAYNPDDEFGKIVTQVLGLSESS